MNLDELKELILKARLARLELEGMAYSLTGLSRPRSKEIARLISLRNDADRCREEALEWVRKEILT